MLVGLQSCQQVHHYYCWADHARLLETELDGELPALLQKAVEIDSCFCSTKVTRLRYSGF